MRESKGDGVMACVMYGCIVSYCTRLLANEGKMEASTHVTSKVLCGRSGDGDNKYRARCIRKWCQYFLDHGRLPAVGILN